MASSVINIQMNGVNELIKYMDGLKSNIEKELGKSNKAFMEDVKMDAQKFAPKDTGELKNSIEVVPTKQKGYSGQWKLVVNSPYGIYQEYGFRPHPLFVNENTNTTKLPFGWITVKKNTPFVQPAIEHNLMKLSATLNNAMSKALGQGKSKNKAGGNI